MSKESQAIQGAPQQLLALVRRIEALTKNSQGKEWPYSSLPAATLLFASNISENAMRVIGLAAEQIGLQAKFAGGTVQDVVVGRNPDELFALIASQTGFGKEAVGASRAAAYELYRGMAADMIGRAERCLEGDETIDGREIKHGPLYDK